MSERFTVQLEMGSKDASGKLQFFTIETKDIPNISGGGAITVDVVRNAEPAPGKALFFRALVDSTSKIDEGKKEGNNYSKVLGPFIFE